MHFAAQLEDAAPLAQLVHAKTAGNPFFVLQFLYALAEERLLAFDHRGSTLVLGCRSHSRQGLHRQCRRPTWSASSPACRTKPRKRCSSSPVSATSPTSRRSRSSSATSEDEVHAALWEAVRLELVERLSSGYRFVHDRVQEAAYSLIPEEQRAAAHLRIGRLLVAQTPAREARRGDLRDRQSAQSRRRAYRLAGRAGTSCRVEPDCGQAREGRDGVRLGAEIFRRRRGAVGRRLLDAPACAHLRARAAAGRMRVPHGRTGGSGRALGGAFTARRRHRRTSDCRGPAHRCVHDTRSGRPRHRRRSRLPKAASRHRLVAASDRRGGATRIRADLVAAREPDDRGAH